MPSLRKQLVLGAVVLASALTTSAPAAANPCRGRGAGVRAEPSQRANVDSMLAARWSAPRIPLARRNSAYPARPSWAVVSRGEPSRGAPGFYAGLARQTGNPYLVREMEWLDHETAARGAQAMAALNASRFRR